MLNAGKVQKAYSLMCNVLQDQIRGGKEIVTDPETGRRFFVARRVPPKAVVAMPPPAPVQAVPEAMPPPAPVQAVPVVQAAPAKAVEAMPPPAQAVPTAPAKAVASKSVSTSGGNGAINTAAPQLVSGASGSSMSHKQSFVHSAMNLLSPSSLDQMVSLVGVLVADPNAVTRFLEGEHFGVF